jgi:hypothetical protein
MLQKEEELERADKKRLEAELEKAKTQLTEMLPAVLRPFATLLDIETYGAMEGLRVEHGWFNLNIPGLSLITVLVNNHHEKQPIASYHVHGHAAQKNVNVLNEDWDRTVLFARIADYRIALAHAWRLWQEHETDLVMKVNEKSSQSNVEPEYVPFEQDLIDSNGQFDTPLAMYWSKYMLNELVRFINCQIIQQRETQVKK